MLATEPHITESDAGRGVPPPSRHGLRLLVVDDHPAVQRGLRGLLEDQPDFSVVDVVGSAEAAMSIAEREQIDVAVLDYQLGGRNGLWASRKLKRMQEPPSVVIYSAYSDGPLAAAAVVAEADALISKGGLGAELCETIRGVADGRSRLPIVPRRLGELIRRRLDGEEQAIYGMLLARTRPAEIARTLRLPETGLESRLWEMLRKLETMETRLSPPVATHRDR
jgi:DNA-binding NarL/FixJ family response regulator